MQFFWINTINKIYIKKIKTWIIKQCKYFWIIKIKVNNNKKKEQDLEVFKDYILLLIILKA